MFVEPSIAKILSSLVHVSPSIVTNFLTAKIWLGIECIVNSEAQPPHLLWSLQPCRLPVSGSNHALSGCHLANPTKTDRNDVLIC